VQFVTVYLNFNGNAEEASESYRSVLGGGSALRAPPGPRTLDILPVSESSMPPRDPGPWHSEF
jgi:hypothetical protein